MFELIVCVAVTWSTRCQMQTPVVYPSVYFCERAAVKVAARADVRMIYCRERK